MKISRLPGLEDMPVVIEPSRTQEATLDGLLDWAEAEHEKLDRELLTAGAVLIRGFAINGPGDLSRASASLGGPLQSYVGGDSPRTKVADKVYNSTDFPPHLPIGLHNELSYAGWWPSRIFFHCVTEPSSGGETPIGDSRAIYRNMPERIRDRFERHGVRYVQNLHSGNGPGKSWQQTFETDDRKAVEAYCDRHGMRYRWTDYGLNTSLDRQGVLRHPLAATMSWFNQAEHWHASLQTARFWDAATNGAEADTFAAHCLYGDGSEITKGELEAVCETTAKSEIAFPWRAGDLMMLDNLSCAHGRRPFAGPRKILVAMS
jgi:alpha-ketoglutarate-dependent taurine dioxygenase